MQIVHLEDAPFQQFNLPVNGTTYTFLLFYNRVGDYWTYSVYTNPDTCPAEAGVRIKSGINMLRRVSTTHQLLAVSQPGVAVSYSNWYARMTEPGPGDMAATFLVLGTTEELTALIADEVNINTCV